MLFTSEINKPDTLKGRNYLYIIFTCACMLPFVFPNPIVKTDLQPYAALFGTIIIAIDGNNIRGMRDCSIVIAVTVCTFIAAFYVFCFSEISMTGMRALFNYYSVFVVPYAAMLSFSHFTGMPETVIKRIIIGWFLVSSIQFFIMRSFATSIISGGRYGLQYRGVCGLASEPSFFGIACFYFLHLVKRLHFDRNKYYFLVLLMGTLYAQSTLGILFMAAFWITETLDNPDVIKFVASFIITALVAAVLWFIISHYLQGTRLYDLLSKIIQGNKISIYDDESVGNRVNEILNSLRIAFEGGLIPQGFHSRIGSGFGGFLVELGFLAIPEILVITFALSLTPNSVLLRYIYFAVVLLLHFNNTQIGNPILLYTVGYNIYLESTHKCNALI